MIKVIRYKLKPKTAFHPRLELRSTGFAPEGQWCGQFFKPGVYCGLSSIRQMPTVKEAVEHYLSELKRCNHEVYSQ